MTAKDLPAHTPGTGRGERKSEIGGEKGRKGRGSSGRERPAGERTARDATSINAEARGPIDPAMPHMPPA